MLNTLPGISTRSLDAIANGDRVTYLGVIEAISERVAMRIETDFAANIGIELKSYNEVFCTGRIDDPLTYVPANAVPGLQGLVFEFLQSKQLVMHVLKLYFRSDIAQTINFFIIDLFTNDLLDTITLELEPGENEFYLGNEYFPQRHSNKLFIGYDGSTTGYYSTSDSECYDGCHCGCPQIRVCGCNKLVSGYKNEYTHDTYGLSIEWAIACSYCRLLTENIHLFKTAIMYAAGVEYMLELWGSDRLNKYTTTKADENEKLLEYYKKMYISSLKSVTQNLNLCDHCCFECKGGIQYKYVDHI
jgi:hypothetical protein